MRIDTSCKYYEDDSAKNGLTRGLTEAQLQGVTRDARNATKSQTQAKK